MGDGRDGECVGVDRRHAAIRPWLSRRLLDRCGRASRPSTSCGECGRNRLPLVGLQCPRKAVGGGLFLRDKSGSWLRQLDSLATEVREPPSWLAERPGVQMSIVRSGTAYALVLPPTSARGCSQPIEVVSAAGRSCGIVSFHAECLSRARALDKMAP